MKPAGTNGAASPRQAVESLLARALDRHRAGDVVAAEMLYRQILRIVPSHFDALRLLGLALHNQQKNDEALTALMRAAKVDPKAPNVHSDIGIVLQALGRLGDALASQQRALAINPSHADAIYNRANVLLAMGRSAEALQGFDAMLRIVPDFPPALNNRGLALLNLGRPAEALAPLDRVLALQPEMALGWLNRGNAHLALQQNEAAARDLERALALQPDFDYAPGHLLHAQMRVCDWSGLAAGRARLLAGVRAGQRAAMPFVFVSTTDSALDQQLCARIFAARGEMPKAERSRAAPARERIRVGYVSGSFGGHAVMVLMGGLVELHDPARFDIVAFSTAKDASALHARGGPALERIVDVSDQGDAAIADSLRAQGIDIAVDIDGFTGETRSFALAGRPAPVQVNFLGYPGTMGAPWIDYVLADRLVIPPEHQAFFDEKVVFLPDSYQANDSRRLVATQGPGRAEAGLPEGGFVFCSFNAPVKITPEMFAIWMRLLAKVEGSVLWLLGDEPALQRNLRREAEALGVAPERIVFAPRLAPEAHLWRHRHADLFLDTLPYNAHTTASDALWAGLPVVTCPGGAFAARVGASLLTAIGLPELIAGTPKAYEALATDWRRCG
jgi:protein O-GlcNAc transferase